MTKFSSDLRIKVVMAFEASNNLKGIAREFGVGEKTARNWIKRYKAGGIKQLVSNNQRYTQDFKLYAIEYRWQNDLSYGQAAADLEIPNEGTLYAWEKRYLAQGLDGLQNTQKGRPPIMIKKEEKAEKNLSREQELEVEIAQLRMENAYLKKLNALVQEREKSEKKPK